MTIHVCHRKNYQLPPPPPPPPPPNEPPPSEADEPDEPANAVENPPSDSVRFTAENAAAFPSYHDGAGIVIFSNTFAPSKNTEQFMQYLPYAISFGVEKEWAKVASRCFC